MKNFENQIPILLEFRGMESPVTVTVPQPVMRYLDIYARRERNCEGEVIYKQGDRAWVMPECLLPRRFTNVLRP